MRESFTAYWPRLLEYEGGFDKDPRDPGNWTGGKVGSGKLLGTKYGIAANTFPNEDIPNLTKERAETLYHAHYAPAVRFDELPAGPDVVTLDAGINSGPKRGVQWLQSTVGVTADGNPGPETMKAVLANDDVATCQGVCKRRLSFVQGLSTFATYGKGWTRRIAAVEAFGVRLALEAHRQGAVVVANRLDEESGKATQEARKATQGASGSVGVGTAGGVGDRVLDGSLGIRVAIIFVIVAAVAALVVFLWRNKVNKERADAYKAEAARAKAGT